MTIPLCDVCRANPIHGVASVPHLPMVFGYCTECQVADTYPYWSLVGNTAISGSIDKVGPWWEDIVTRSLDHLGVDRATFDSDVRGVMAAIRAADVERERYSAQDTG